MSNEPKEIPAFLTKLNEVSALERRSQFGYYVPKGNNLKLAYAYCYLVTEKEARELASWLLIKSIDSEILYVENKKKFLVKIPFLNTYYSPEHFVTGEIPADIIKMQADLAEVIKKVDLEWAPTCSRLSRTLTSLFQCGQQHRQLKIQDFCQTTLFMTGVDNSSDTTVSQLVPEVAIPDHFWKYVGQQVEKFISDITTAHNSWKMIEEIIISQTSGRGETALKAALQSFHNSRKNDISDFCQICTTDLFTFSKALKLDNLFYQQRLLIAKQTQTVEEKPEFSSFLEKWNALKNRCILAYKQSAAMLKTVPKRLYPEVSLTFFKQFLLFETLGSVEKKEILSEKRIGLERAGTNTQNTQELTEKYEKMKDEILNLSRELFSAMNTGKPPEPQSTESAKIENKMH